MSREQNSALIEHTLNIRAGISTLKTKYGIHVDEYDYLDIAVDALRDIRHFGTTQYLGMAKVRAGGKVTIPCYADSIDAVTTRHMAKKVFKDRVTVKLYDEKLDGDYFYSFYNNVKNVGYGSAMPSVHFDNPYEDTFGIDNSLPGLAYRRDRGYIPYTLQTGEIQVAANRAGESIGVAFTGLAVDLEGFPLITRKQANALAAAAARYHALKEAGSGNKAMAAMVEFYTSEAARTKQAASIAEDISDNEIDDLLDAKTTFNRKSVNRPTKYTR